MPGVCVCHSTGRGGNSGQLKRRQGRPGTVAYAAHLSHPSGPLSPGIAVSSLLHQWSLRGDVLVQSVLTTCPRCPREVTTCPRCPREVRPQSSLSGVQCIKRCALSPRLQALILVYGSSALLCLRQQARISDTTGAIYAFLTTSILRYNLRRARRTTG